MIPKIIHYCWFSGDAKPESIQQCIDSWSEIMPDYEIRCWGPDSFDFDSIPFVKEAKEKRKWAFMADYVRLYALYTEGGIYLDSDVMAFKKFDDFLHERFFIGSECGDIKKPDVMSIDGAIFGSEAGHPFLKKCMDYYKTLHFINPDGTLNNTPQPIVLSKLAESLGYEHKNLYHQLSDGIAVYPTSKFTHICDPEYNDKLKDLYAVHLLNHSWIDVSPGYTLCKKLHILPLYPVLKPFFILLKKIGLKK